MRTPNLKDTQSGFKPFRASTSEAGARGGELHDPSELIPRAQAGEHGAFTQLIEPHMGKVYHGAFRITRNREDAEDACQQALLKAYSHIDQFQAFVREPQSQGRKLEFLTQEMVREANTIGSKANNVQVAHAVVEIKSAIERIREVVQNVE